MGKGSAALSELCSTLKVKRIDLSVEAGKGAELT